MAIKIIICIIWIAEVFLLEIRQRKRSNNAQIVTENKTHFKIATVNWPLYLAEVHHSVS